MNPVAFQTYLTPQWQFHLPKSRGEGAEQIANAYHLSNIGQTTTPFAAPLLNADKTILKTFVQLSLDINYYGGQIVSSVSTVLAAIRGAIQAVSDGSKDGVVSAKTIVDGVIKTLVKKLPAPLAFIGPILSDLVNSIFGKLLASSGTIDFKEIYKCMKKLQGVIDLLDVSAIAYTVMSTGFCLYWLTASMSPVPPMPPCIAPTGGTIILVPGLPTPLNSDLKKTFYKGNTVPQAIQLLYNSLALHQFMIIGVYLGIVPFFPSPIPAPPIPWFSMLNIPFPNISIPKFMGGTGGPNSGGGTKPTAIDGATAGLKLKKALDSLRKQAENTKKC